MRLLTVKEAAELIRMSENTVRMLCDTGALKFCRPTGNPRGARRIAAESVESYIASLVGEKPPALSVLTPELDDSEAEMLAIAKRLRKAR